MRRGQEREKAWNPEIVPHRAVLIDVTAELRDRGLPAPLFRLDPGVENPSERQPLAKSVLGRQRDHGFRDVTHRPDVAHQLMDQARDGQCVGNAARVGKILGEGEAIAAALE